MRIAHVIPVPLHVLLLFAALCTTGFAAPQNYASHRRIASASRTLPDNHDINPEGLGFTGELVDIGDGRLFAAAFKGGANGTGTIFYVTDGPNAGPNTFPTPIYTFSAAHAASPGDPAINADGANPQGLTLGPDGLLYGVTNSGGAYGNGVIFKITTGGAITTIHSFGALSTDPVPVNADGAIPDGKVVFAPDGSLYGVTRFGGSAGTGTVYRVAADMTFSTVYSFAAVDTAMTNSTGGGPRGGLTLGRDGNLYGMAEYGGASGSGVIFRLTPAGGFTVLHEFVLDFTSNSDGRGAAAALLLASDGNFYGTTPYGGGSGDGVIFRISPDGTYAILHQFRSFERTPPLVDGAMPMAPLIELPDGRLAGTTSDGYGGAHGTVFVMSTNGDFVTLHEFVDGDGVGLESGLTRTSDGTLYGITGGLTTQNFELGRASTIFALKLTDVAPITLTLSPQFVPLGESYTLSWDAPVASCSFAPDGPYQGASGSLVYAANGATTGRIIFRAYCRTEDGDATVAAVEVTTLPPPVVTLTVDRSSITLGETATIFWSATFADTCEASGSWSGVHETSGGAEETPTTPGVYDYTITCTNSKGTGSATVSLTVKDKPAPTPPPPAAGNGGGGGGAVEEATLLGLLGLLWLRHRPSRSRVRASRRLPNAPADFRSASSVGVMRALAARLPGCDPGIAIAAVAKPAARALR